MIVADAGPLIAFARIGRLDLLRLVVREVVIPQAVYEELVLKGKGKPGAAELEAADWIQPKALAHRASPTLPPTSLHPGEADAILLAEQLNAPLLIDERRGRKGALDRGVDVLGSLAILAQAKRQGLIDRAKPLLGAMLAAGYWIDEELIPAFLAEVGESQP